LVVQFIFRVLLTVGRVVDGLDSQRVTACLSRVNADKLQYGNCLPAVMSNKAGRAGKRQGPLPEIPEMMIYSLFEHTDNLETFN
jgi:hypothetical protein